MLFRFTNGLTTVTLSPSGVSLGVTYTPTATRDERVAESVPLVLEGTATAVRALMNQIELMFNAARWSNEKVYLEHRPEDTGDILRARVYDGYVLWDKEPIKRMLSSVNGLVEGTLIFERSGQWQGPEEELYLSSSTQSERIGGVTITMAQSANWVQILDSRVKGTDKAPIRLRVTNSSGVGLDWTNFYWGLNAFSSPTNVDLWLGASETTAGNGGRSWSANSGSNHENLTWLIPLSATTLAKTYGRSFKVIAIFNNTVSMVNTFLRAQIGVWLDSYFLPQVVGMERAFQREVVDLGELPFPPGGVGVSNANSALCLTVRAVPSGGATLNYVMLMPTDSSRHFTQMGFIADPGDYIEDNGIDGGIATVDAVGRYSIIQASKTPLKVYPSRTQRIYLIMQEMAGFTTSRSLTVQAWYRPIYDNF